MSPCWLLCAKRTPAGKPQTGDQHNAEESDDPPLHGPKPKAKVVDQFPNGTAIRPVALGFLRPSRAVGPQSVKRIGVS
jgi:hypothetical protein